MADPTGSPETKRVSTSSSLVGIAVSHWKALPMTLGRSAMMQPDPDRSRGNGKRDGASLGTAEGLGVGTAQPQKSSADLCEEEERKI